MPLTCGQLEPYGAREEKKLSNRFLVIGPLYIFQGATFTFPEELETYPPQVRFFSEEDTAKSWIGEHHLSRAGTLEDSLLGGEVGLFRKQNGTSALGSFYILDVSSHTAGGSLVIHKFWMEEEGDEPPISSLHKNSTEAETQVVRDLKGVEITESQTALVTCPGLIWKLSRLEDGRDLFTMVIEVPAEGLA
jgi:hypothetical protein